MPKAKAESSRRKTRPAATPEGRESQIIAAAMDLAEKQILEGTASSAVIVHYLKLGTSRSNLEREKLERENELLRAKTEAIAAQKESSELYAEALRAMKRYSGVGDYSEDED